MISVEHLTKCYGDFLAVDDLSFSIEEGHVYGFLGPNGAGKSTTMNMITGCLSATQGSIRIDGFDIYAQPQQAKKRIGYLPEQPPLYVNESVEEYLYFIGRAKGLKGQALDDQITSVIAQTGIAQVSYRRISTLSKGYRQRVGIAQALLGDPKVIILDEPTVGLDPIQIIEIRDLIRELGKNHTVIFSSHILSEVQAICDRILIIHHGKLVAFDAPENLEKNMLAEITLTTDAPKDKLISLISRIEALADYTVGDPEKGMVTARLQIGAEDIYSVSRQIYFASVALDVPLLEMSLHKANLEDIFLELTEAPQETEEESA